MPNWLDKLKESKEERDIRKAAEAEDKRQKELYDAQRNRWAAHRARQARQTRHPDATQVLSQQDRLLIAQDARGRLAAQQQQQRGQSSRLPRQEISPQRPTSAGHTRRQSAQPRNGSTTMTPQTSQERLRQPSRESPRPHTAGAGAGSSFASPNARQQASPHTASQGGAYMLGVQNGRSEMTNAIMFKMGSFEAQGKKFDNYADPLPAELRGNNQDIVDYWAGYNAAQYAIYSNRHTHQSYLHGQRVGRGG